jgi:hypothetical protein
MSEHNISPFDLMNSAGIFKCPGIYNFSTFQ